MFQVIIRINKNYFAENINQCFSYGVEKEFSVLLRINMSRDSVVGIATG
jgi:hypothetical protein